MFFYPTSSPDFQTTGIGNALCTENVIAYMLKINDQEFAALQTFWTRIIDEKPKISFFSFYRLKILSGKKIFLFCIGSIYHGCETCKKTCQLSERRKSIELLTQFCCRSKSPCLQKTTLIFHEDFCFSGMDIYHKECYQNATIIYSTLPLIILLRYITI